MPSQDLAPQWLTPKQAAALLGVSYRTALRLGLSGRITCYRVGGGVRFQRPDVEGYLDSVRITAAS
jgi:excisionase family DNA binding protein